VIAQFSIIILALIFAARTANMLTPINSSAQSDPRMSASGKSFALEQILSLEMIRHHTKTEDMLTVLDEQLSLYRRVALEAAEKYTGLLFTGQRVISEPVEQPMSYWSSRRISGTFTHQAKHMFAQPMAYLYGQIGRAPQTIGVRIGTSQVQISYHPEGYGLDCCNPCKQNDQLMLQYTAGYICESDVPAAVAMGALKYIAHLISNPGDNNTGGVYSAKGSTGQKSNPALASGAIDIWRVIRDDAI
jgi:hypothetical protein